MKKLIIFIFICIFLISAKSAYAAFQLTVTPQTSRIDINFGRVKPGEQVLNQEVKIAVANDTGAQYRIIQQANQPLMNQANQRIDEANFLVYATQKSSYGIYGIETPTPVTRAPLAMYTSDSGGQSVSFIAVFGLNISGDMPSGIYTSSVTFTLQPLTQSAGILEKSATLNVSVEIEPVFEMKIIPTTGRNNIRFRYTGKETQPLTNEITVEVKSNIGSRYRIYQQIYKPLTNDAGQTISADNFLFSTQGLSAGSMAFSSNTPVSSEQTVIYTSDPDSSSASFSIYYTLLLEDQRAGSYSGVLVFTCQPQEAAVNEATNTLDIFCEVEPIFNLSILMQEGDRGINFGHLKEKGKQIRQVTLQIASNLGKQYQILQEVSGLLINKKGIVMPAESFQVLTEGCKKGTVKITNPAPVEEGQTVLYVSNENGDPDEIRVVYQLSVPPDTPEGDYSTGISYSLSTL